MLMPRLQRASPHCIASGQAGITINGEVVTEATANELGMGGGGGGGSRRKAAMLEEASACPPPLGPPPCGNGCVARLLLQGLQQKVASSTGLHRILLGDHPIKLERYRED